eukprot:m.1079971 g.1079971  ORF g.1079971 m.1079971 type:complete len:448 (-) comp24255_c0_seq5:1277-2620(-)
MSKVHNAMGGVSDHNNGGMFSSDDARSGTEEDSTSQSEDENTTDDSEESVGDIHDNAERNDITSSESDSEHDHDPASADESEANDDVLGFPIGVHVIARLEHNAETSDDISCTPGDTFVVLGPGTDEGFVQVQKLFNETSTNADSLVGQLPATYLEYSGPGRDTSLSKREQLDQASTSTLPLSQFVRELFDHKQLPQGFRRAWVAGMDVAQRRRMAPFGLASLLHPAMDSASGLGFEGIVREPSQGKIKRRHVRTMCFLTLMNASGVPQLNSTPRDDTSATPTQPSESTSPNGLVVVDRRARVVLVDGHGAPCSNVCLVRASLVRTRAGGETWSFGTGAHAVGGDSADNRCVVRCDAAGVAQALIELSYVVRRRTPSGWLYRHALSLGRSTHTHAHREREREVHPYVHTHRGKCSSVFFCTNEIMLYMVLVQHLCRVCVQQGRADRH